jgi:hypothetical protein
MEPVARGTCKVLAGNGCTEVLNVITHPSGITPRTEHEARTLEYGDLLRAVAEESDRGLVITSAAHVEIYLERILRAFLIDEKGVDDLLEGPFAPFGSLSAKTKTAHLMGLITKREANCVEALRKVRNVFAHELDASFEHPAVKKLCAKPPIFDGRLVDRDAFLHMAMNIVVRLIYRDIGVASHYKRKALTDQERSRLDRPEN